MSLIFTKDQQVAHQNIEPLNFHFQQVSRKEHPKNSGLLPQSRINKQSLFCQLQDQSRKANFLIKINRNIENAFPSNFFSNPSTNKNESQKRYHSAQKNHFKISLKRINQNSKQHLQTQAAHIRSNKRYQSIKVQPISEKLKQKLHQLEPLNVCRFRSSESLQTSIQRRQMKVDNSFSFEKQKDLECNILPKTAATLDNLDDEDLLNITFGNGWKNINQEDLSKYQNQQSVILTKNCLKQTKLFRLRNVQSLELKKPNVKNLNKKQGVHFTMIQNLLKKEINFQRSDRKPFTHHSKRQKVFKMYNNEDDNEKQFLKQKLNVDEIVRKKTTTEPKMKNPMKDFPKKDNLNKLMKLVF